LINIKEWSGRRVLSLWLVGAVAEAFVMLAVLRTDTIRALGPPAMMALWGDSAVLPVDWRRALADERFRSGLDSLGVKLTIEGDSSATFVFPDSSSISVGAGVVRLVHNSGQGAESLDLGLQAALGASWKLLLLLVAYLLVIPASLAILTLVWFWQRRKARRGQGADAVDA
jgi:hypothetical protein